jgi:hypothetical protein
MEFTMAILFFVFPLTRAELRHSSEKERKKRERERERRNNKKLFLSGGGGQLQSSD